MAALESRLLVARSLAAIALPPRDVTVDTAEAPRRSSRLRNRYNEESSVCIIYIIDVIVFRTVFDNPLMGNKRQVSHRHNLNAQT